MVEFLDQAAEIAYTITVAVIKGTGKDLVTDGVVPPMRRVRSRL
jgi:hypothetical protein